MTGFLLGYAAGNAHEHIAQNLTPAQIQWQNESFTTAFIIFGVAFLISALLAYNTCRR